MRQSVSFALSVVLVLLLAQGQWCDTSAVAPAACGKRNPDGIGFRSRDTDGESKYGEFPWMVAILKKDQFLKFYQCGGSLIHPNVVLTAAHSVDSLSPAQLMIRAGEWDIATEGEKYPHQDRNVTEVVLHPEYYRQRLYNDVALLFLDSPVTLNEAIQPVCLPPPETTFNHQRCFVTGWGKDASGTAVLYQVILKKVELAIVPTNKCQTALRTTRLGGQFILHSSFICALGANQKDTCQGDGGSPLVCPVEGSDQQYHQAGIVSWGIGCGENDVPGVYANVAKARSWIDQEMQNKFFDTSSYISQGVDKIDLF